MKTGLCLALILIFSVEASVFRIIDIKFKDWMTAESNACNIFNVTFYKNFTLQNNEYIQLTVVNYDVSNNFKCSSINDTSGFCYVPVVLGNTNSRLDFTLHTPNTQKLLFSEIVPTRIEDRAGPLKVHIKEIKTTGVELFWLRPWKEFCSLSSIIYLQEYFGSSKMNITDGNVVHYHEGDFCFLESNLIYVCSRSLNKLKPDTEYVYKTKYTTDDPQVEHWSEWSKTLKFTTKSLVPVASPALQCDFKDDLIKVSWKSSVTLATIASLFFKVQYGNEVFIIKAVDDENHIYRYNIDVGLAKTIYLRTCSNSGCATLDTSDNSCIINTDDEKLNYRWFLFLLLPISIFVIVVVFRKNIWQVIEKITNQREVGLVGPRIPEQPPAPVITHQITRHDNHEYSTLNLAIVAPNNQENTNESTTMV